jgi:hypothetical protein
MKNVVTIAPVAGERGLIAYECQVRASDQRVGVTGAEYLKFEHHFAKSLSRASAATT